MGPGHPPAGIHNVGVAPPPPPGQESEGEEAEQSRVELPAEAGARPGARQSRVRLYEVRGWWWCRWWWCGAALGGV